MAWLFDSRLAPVAPVHLPAARVQPVVTMLQYRLYGGHKMPAGLQGFVKAGANIGSVIGQFAFGASASYLAFKEG